MVRNFVLWALYSPFKCSHFLFFFYPYPFPLYYLSCFIVLTHLVLQFYISFDYFCIFQRHFSPHNFVIFLLFICSQMLADLYDVTRKLAIFDENALLVFFPFFLSCYRKEQLREWEGEREGERIAS